MVLYIMYVAFDEVKKYIVVLCFTIELLLCYSLLSTDHVLFHVCGPYTNQLVFPLIQTLQDYIKESDNLVSLHDQIRDCDSILSQMETLLSGFQVC